MDIDIKNDVLTKKINYYCKDKHPIKVTSTSLSVANLIIILKDYYQELYNMFDTNSNFYKALLEEVNNILYPKYAYILKKKQSDFSIVSIRKMVKNGISMISHPMRYFNRIRCDNICVCIRQDTYAVMLDIYEKGEEKPIIVCRDIDNEQLYLAKDSCNNEKLLELMYSEFVNIFDIIDSFRATLPKQSSNSQINRDTIENADSFDKFFYEVPYSDEIFKGSVKVYANGAVVNSLELIDSDGNASVITSEIVNIDEILERISIDISKLENPIKSIVLSSFEKEYNVIEEEYKTI